LLLLRSSLGAPKLLYTLRTSPCYGHQCLSTYDNHLHAGLEKILNITLTDHLWTQATLPVSRGGLGFRRVPQLALPAFLASAAGTLDLQNAIMRSDFSLPYEPLETFKLHWIKETDASLPEAQFLAKQCHWDKPLIEKDVSLVRDTMLDATEKSRWEAVSAPRAGAWLMALPIAACGLRLDDETVRVAVGLRLDAFKCELHHCPCGQIVSALGSHDLSLQLLRKPWWAISTVSVANTKVSGYRAFVVTESASLSGFFIRPLYFNVLYVVAGTNVYSLWDYSGTNDEPFPALMRTLIHRIQALYPHH